MILYPIYIQLMIKQLFIGIIIASSQLIHAQEIQLNEYNVKTHLNDFHLNGKVTKVISTAKDGNGHWATLPFLENEFFNQIILEFNSQGYLQKQTNNLDYRGNLATYSYTEYQYNRQHQPTEIKTTVINNGEDPKRISSLKTYEYNPDGQLQQLYEAVQSKTTSIQYQTEFSYTNRLESVVRKTDGKKSGELKFSYNKVGQLIKQESFGFDGRNGQKRYFMYDGNTPIYEELNIDGRAQMTFVDLNYKTSKFQQFDQNQQLKLELNFDSNHHVTAAKVQSFRTGKPFLSTYTIQYQSDAQNNWIRADIYQNGILEYIVQREITY